jgi:hypothetical protein
MFIFTDDQRLHVASKLYEDCRRFISLTESSVFFSDVMKAEVAQGRASSFANPKKNASFQFPNRLRVSPQ